MTHSTAWFDGGASDLTDVPGDVANQFDSECGFSYTSGDDEYGHYVTIDTGSKTVSDSSVLMSSCDGAYTVSIGHATNEFTIYVKEEHNADLPSGVDDSVTGDGSGC